MSARDAVDSPEDAESRPTPVRESLEPSGSPAAAEPDLDFLAVELEGRPWVVRAMGRGRAGPSSAPASVLLLGFFDEGSAEKASREALVVGTDLSSLRPSEIEEAFRASRPVRDPTKRKELFAESSSKRRRGGS
jgi:hypothetical protein